MSSTTTARAASPVRPDRPGGAPSGRTPLWMLKLLMSITGLTWAVFVTIHMWGNLKVFSGAASFDAYAGWLREVAYPLIPHEGVLWLMRFVLVPFLVIHVVVALMIWSRSRAARGPRRARRRGWRMWNATLMLPTGVLILAFVLFHVADLTLGWGFAAANSFVAPGDGGSPYANLIASFMRPGAAVFYAVTMLAIAVHVLHGVLLAVNDLGATGATFRQVMVWVGGILAVAILLGNAAIPVAVQMGVLS